MLENHTSLALRERSACLGPLVSHVDGFATLLARDATPCLRCNGSCNCSLRSAIGSSDAGFTVARARIGGDHLHRSKAARLKENTPGEDCAH